MKHDVAKKIVRLHDDIAFVFLYMDTRSPHHEVQEYITDKIHTDLQKVEQQYIKLRESYMQVNIDEIFTNEDWEVVRAKYQEIPDLIKRANAKYDRERA